MIEKLRDLINGKTKIDLYANYPLEVAVRLLEAWKAGVDIKPLKRDVLALDKKLRNRSITRRSPSNIMQDSHDNAFAHMVLDALYGTGFCGEFLAHRGLWKTGNPHGSILGFKVDSEWLTNWRPEYLGFARMVLGQDNLIDRIAVHLNLRFSKTWNLLRARLLLLEYLGVQGLEKYNKRLGDKFKGRYGNEPIINELWGMQNGTNRP